MNKMNAVLNVREIETMSSCSWNTNNSIGMSAEHRASMMYDGHPSSRSPNSQHGSQQGFSTKYPIKTLCFAKKSSTMPTKEEYSVLLSCGLGARKWQVSLDYDEAAFQNAIYKIYPRLNAVASYTLWNIKKDKTFEKLPAKVNTPNRIRAYLGNQFSGCLLIMPSEEIQLVSDVMEKTDLRPPTPKESNKAPHHLTDQETTIYSGTALSSLQISQDPVSLKRNHTGTGTGIDVSYPFSPPSHREPKHQSNCRSQQPPRSFCLVCGKVPKQPNASPFYDVETATLPTGNSEKSFDSLSKKLREVIKIPDSHRNKLVPSKEVCKKCFRQLVDIDFMENQIRKMKEEMMGSFLANVTKVSNKLHSPTYLASNSAGTGDPNTYTHTTPTNTIRSSTSDLPLVSPSTHSLDGAAMTHHRQIVTNTVVNRQSLFSGSSSRGTNSITNSYPWEMGNTDHQGLMRKHLDARQKANSVGYGRNQQQETNPSSYESMMTFNNERQISRGRRTSHNVSTLPNRSVSHDASYFRDPQYGMMAGGNPNVQYSDITSVPSSQNGDVGTSNASDVYPIYRRARSSPPRITDIPSSYLIDNDKLMRNHVYPEDYNNKAPVNLSSNSSSGNEEKSAMTMAAVSAERCTDWVSDSTECIKQNDLRNDNHYSLKDAGDTGSPSESEGKKKGTKRERSNEKRGNFTAGQPSSGEDSAAASCGSTPLMEGEGDDSSNSSDKDNVSHPNGVSSSHADKRANEKESKNKRVHYQDHKLSAKNIKHHQKQNRRLQRSPMKLVQSMSTAFQKPVKSKKQKTAKHGGGEEFEEKDDENGSKNNGASDSNNSGEWTRSSSNTPSPPTSFGSVGSNDNSSSTDPSSTDPSTDTQQTMSTHFPKPFWKKRFCEDSGENSSTSQQAHDSSHFSTGSKVKSQSDLETSTNSSGIGMEETHHLGKRRKIEIYEDDATASYARKKQNESKTREMEVESQYSSNHGSSLEDLSRRSSPVSEKEGVNEFEKEQQQRSNDSSPGVPNFTEASNTISTDSGHDSREVSD